MPVYRLERMAPTPEELEARAIVLACALRDGEGVEPTPGLHEWAEDALADKATTGRPFEDPDLELRYDAERTDVLSVRDLGVEWVNPEDPDGLDAEPEPEVVETALFEVHDRLIELGLVSEDSVSTGAFSMFTQTSPGPNGTLVSYGAPFGLLLSGVHVRGPRLEVQVVHDGELGEIALGDLDISHVGDEPVALSEEEAKAEFEALADQARPSPELETHVSTLLPHYFLSPDVDAADREVRIHGYYAHDDPNSGTFGDLNFASLSMVWPEEGLQPD